MVLQREPHSPSVWGFGPPGSSLSLTLTGPSAQTPAHYEGEVGGDGVWSVSVGSWPAGQSDNLRWRMWRVMITQVRATAYRPLTTTTAPDKV